MQTIKVSNVKCGGCVSAIQNGLAEMEGITSVEVDIPSGVVTLQENNADIEAIRQKLQDLGYPPVN